jgi:uncharacterized protein YecE (DUF72 family)
LQRAENRRRAAERQGDGAGVTRASRTCAHPRGRTTHASAGEDRRRAHEPLRRPKRACERSQGRRARRVDVTHAGVIRFGPAGWEYPDWSGTVYPRPEPRGFDRLRYLAGFFDTVEVNASFYRPFPASVAERWCERVADVAAFRFSAKVWRRFTHERGEAYGSEDVKAARAALDAMHRAGRLGAALLQFPWSFKRTEENEEWLRGLFRAFAGLPLVLEVRHDSWDLPEVLGELAEAGVGIVNVDQPLFRRSIRPHARVTSPVAYVRVHGRNWKDWFRKNAGRDARYDYLYAAGELEPWAERIRALEAAPPKPDVYVVTNNHFEGKAAANAKMLESMVEGKKVEAPPDLVRTYAEALGRFVRERGAAERT